MHQNSDIISSWDNLGWITHPLALWNTQPILFWVLVVRVCGSYLMNNELMGAIWQSPAILLHQRNKGVAKQFLLSLVFSCKNDNTWIRHRTKTHKHRLQENKQSTKANITAPVLLFSSHAIQLEEMELCKSAVNVRWPDECYCYLFQYSQPAKCMDGNWIHISKYSLHCECLQCCILMRNTEYKTC